MATQHVYENQKMYKRKTERVNKTGIVILSIIMLALITGFLFMMPQTSRDSSLANITPASGGVPARESVTSPDVANQIPRTGP